MKCFIILFVGKHTSLIFDTRLLNWDPMKISSERMKIKLRVVVMNNKIKIAPNFTIHRPTNKQSVLSWKKEIFCAAVLRTSECPINSYRDFPFLTKDLQNRAKYFQT
jgi:hypothetical protein